MDALSGFRAAALAVVAALLLASCGGGDDGDSGDSEAPATLAAADVVAAFEEAAGGYPFEEATSLVDGASAYGPKNSGDVEVVAPINDALGDASILWQVFVFDGTDPPLDAEAAKAVGFSSNTWKEISPGVFLGDSDIAYSANGNVVISGPVLDGDPEDPTLAGWKGVLDGL